MRGCKARRRLALGERERERGGGERIGVTGPGGGERKGSGLEIDFNNAQNFASSLCHAGCAVCIRLGSQGANFKLC